MPSALVSEWKSGPEWFYYPSHLWPIRRLSASRDNDEAEVELRPTEVKQLLVAAEPILKQEKHSSFSRLVRVMAWVPGFLPNLKRSDGTIKTSLTASEINKAEKVLIRRTQRGAFGEELAALRAKKPWVAS